MHHRNTFISNVPSVLSLQRLRQTTVDVGALVDNCTPCNPYRRVDVIQYGRSDVNEQWLVKEGLVDRFKSPRSITNLIVFTIKDFDVEFQKGRIISNAN